MSEGDLPTSNKHETSKITKTQEHCHSPSDDTSSSQPDIPIKKTRQDESASTIPPSPPKHVTIDQLTAAADNFYKMSLAHEITVNSEFKMELAEKPTESLQQCIKESIHKAFWDLQKEKLQSDPPDYSCAINLLKEIKQSLSGLIFPHQHSLNSHIDEQLDISAAENQLAETGKINMAAYANNVIDLMSKWCAPVRDADVASLKQISEPIDFFKKVFAILELMHMDLANFTIEKMRPFIKQQSVGYERAKFESFLEAQKNAGIDGLTRTRHWLQDAHQRLLDSNQVTPSPPSPCYQPVNSSENESRSSIDPVSSSLPPTPNNILREAFLSLLSIDEETFPETFVVDAVRVEELSSCLIKTVTLASLILTICNAVASNCALLFPVELSSLPAGSLTKLKDAVKRDAQGLLDSTPAKNIEELIDVITIRMLAIIDNWIKSDNTVENNTEEHRDVPLSSVSCTLPEPLNGLLVNQIAAILRKEHPVYNLMFLRAIGFLRSALSARPQDPLTLPPGFGTLCTETPVVCEHIAAGGALQRTPISLTNDQKSEKSFNATNLLDQTYDLTIIASRLLPIVVHNRHVFGPFYAEIIQSILLESSTK